MDMIILYLLVIAYIAAINLYAFLFVKTLAKQERAEIQATSAVAAIPTATKETDDTDARSTVNAAPQTQKPQKYIGKLCITGALGGAIAIYACMFIFKFKRNDLFLMVIMPLLGVLNVYMWVLLFKSGFSFLLIR